MGLKNSLVDELVTSLPSLSTLLAQELKTENIQFIDFSPRMSPFEKFLMSVQTGINPLAAKFSTASGVKFLAE